MADNGQSGRLAFYVCLCCLCLISITAIIVSSVALSEVHHIVAQTPAPTPVPAAIGQAVAGAAPRVNAQTDSLRAALLNKIATHKEVKRSATYEDMPELRDIPQVRLQRDAKKAPVVVPQKRVVTLKDRLRQQNA